jgi:hypothetical protein
MIQTSLPPAKMFNAPFILDRNNIKAFIGHDDLFYGKFVFDRDLKRIAIASSHLEQRHIQIAKLFEPRATGAARIIGAFITLERGQDKVMFLLGGRSGAYGLPLQAEFKMVADHIADMLSHEGYTTEIKRYGGNTHIYGRKV